jgi:hypothetical protein
MSPTSRQAWLFKPARQFTLCVYCKQQRRWGGQKPRRAGNSSAVAATIASGPVGAYTSRRCDSNMTWRELTLRQNLAKLCRSQI